MKQKILVIGATGLIGYNVYRVAVDSRLDIIGIARTSVYKGIDNLDIKNSASLKHYIKRKRPSVIVNCAGVVGKMECNKKPEIAVEINEKAALNIAEVCKREDIKLVHLSSVIVHDGKKKVPYTEEDVPSEIEGNWYNITKARAENFIRDCFPEFTIIRIGDTFGYGVNPNHMGGSIFRWAYNDLKKGSDVPAFKGLRSNWILLSGVGKAILETIRMEYEGILNIGGEAIMTSDFFEKMIEKFKLPGRVIIQDLPQDYQANKEMDISKMKKLGIKVSTIEDGLESLVPYYRIK